MTARPTRIDQFLPNYSLRDAIGGHVTNIQKLLKDRGYYSEIFVEQPHPHTTKLAHLYETFDNFHARDGIMLYHYSIGSRLPDFMLGYRNFKMIDYHNITPPDYFRDPEDWNIYQACRRGLRQMDKVRILGHTGWADSAYNAQELVELGFDKYDVLPIMRDYKFLSTLPDVEAAKSIIADGKKNIIFVGRLMPHKAQHDLLQLYKLFHDHVDKNSRLILVSNGPVSYQRKLMQLCKDLDLTVAANMSEKYAGKANILFPGDIDDQTMSTLYRHSHMFLCMSEHEGFCVPLVEAMFFGLPIIANPVTAVPETLGLETGLLFKKDDVGAIVEGMAAVVQQPALAASLKDAAIKRSKAYSWPALEKRFDECLGKTLERYADYNLRTT